MSSPSGIYRGVVARVTATGAVYVTVGRLTGPDHELGPVEVAQGVWTAGLTTEAAGTGPHVHGAGVDLAAGNRVLVAFIEGRVNDVVVLARLA